MVAGLGCVKAMLDAAPARDRPALILSGRARGRLRDVLRASLFR